VYGKPWVRFLKYFKEARIRAALEFDLFLNSDEVPITQRLSSSFFLYDVFIVMVKLPGEISISSPFTD